MVPPTSDQELPETGSASPTRASLQGRSDKDAQEEQEDEENEEEDDGTPRNRRHRMNFIVLYGR